MNLDFVLAMARREGRATAPRLVLYMSAITLGVGALVAINSFKADVRFAVSQQTRALLGADLQLGSRWQLAEPIEALIDSLQGAGVPTARVTSFAAMGLATRSGRTRLLQVRAPSEGYPFYGTIETEPPGLWRRFQASRQALVDPGALVALDAEVGDTLAIGHARFVIAGTVTRVPGDIGLQAAFGPRAFIPARYLGETDLLGYGSLSYRAIYLKLDDAGVAERLVEENDSLFEANRIRSTTVSEYEEDLTSGLDRMNGFLALVGLVALFLGGIGVASGVHVFVSDKLDTVAVLRCLGARQWASFSIYVLQASLMGLGGAATGVGLGIAIQALLPGLLRDFLPLDVPFRFRPVPALTGLGIGLWVALLFALLPLLKIKDVPPLRALRRDYEPTPARRRDRPRLAVYAAMPITLLLLTVWQAPTPVVGLGFAGAAALTALALGLSASLLMRATRRFFPRRARFELRQGIANLFRPHNQTLAITLAIGSGVFLIATLYVVQRNLLDQIVLETRPDRPNLVLLDVQPDQGAGVSAMLDERGAPLLQRTPIVPARLTSINGRPVEEILADSSGSRPARWALLREYRHTYRDTLTTSERLVAGELFGGDDAGTADEEIARVSIEEEIADELNVGIGDQITWSIQGVPLTSEITSIRRVDWARFEPNFFAVFEPGALDAAPQTIVMLTRVDDVTARAELQRDLVRRYPNVAAIDLAYLLEAIDTIIDRVALAIRFMALFSIAAGIVILLGAISTSRYQRARESVLLKTLGARSRTIARILSTEYFALGSLAGLAGVALAAVAGWAAIRFLFELDFRLPAPQLLVFWVGTAILTTAIGRLNSREVVRRTPLAGMREFAE